MLSEILRGIVEGIVLGMLLVTIYILGAML